VDQNDLLTGDSTIRDLDECAIEHTGNLLNK
jgi:hypothetical protein